MILKNDIGDLVIMIQNLKGIHETVIYKNNSNICVYNNHESENYPKHWHTPIEIIMPTINSYSIVLGDHTIHLALHDIILICPGVIHSLHAPEVGERLIFQAEISMLHAIKEFESVLSLISPVVVITPSKSPKIHAQVKELLDQINAEYEENNPLAEVSIYAKLLQIFVLVGSNYTDNMDRFDVGNHKQKEYTEKFISICNYINDHCAEDLTLDDIAKIAGFSKFHFTRLFKQFTNITFYKYLNQKRIAQAELLLSDPEVSITEVAIHSGFSSLSAFIRMFKLIKQCTPTEFRNMYIHPSRL